MKKNYNKKFILKYCSSLSVLVMSIMVLVAGLQAQTKWNMATGYGDSYFQTKNIREFAAEIESRSKNISITVHSGASLFTSPEIFKAVRGGQAEMGELLIASMGNEDPVFNVDSIPFLAVGYDASKRLWDASREIITKKLDKLGVVLLYAVPWPPQNFYTKEKFDDINFFKGKKLRAYNAITSQMAGLLGAVPVTIQVPEIPQAFSTGIVDAMITSGATGVTSQSWDYVKYYTEIEAWMPKNMVFINKRVWRRLSAEDKKIITDAAARAEERGWKYSEEANKQDRETLEKNGMVLVKPNQSMLKDYAEKVGQEMIQDWVDETGLEGTKIIQNSQRSR